MRSAGRLARSTSDSLGHRRVVTSPEQYDDDGVLVAEGHEAVSALDTFCAQQAAGREAIGAEGRERLAKGYEDLGRKLDADPQVQAEREAGGRALEAMQASLAAGESPSLARERAKKASGRAAKHSPSRASSSVT